MTSQTFTVPEVEPYLLYHPMPGADSLLLRKGKCCDNWSLTVYSSEYQTYAQCENCECRCIHPGEDDGQITCWTHHDCFRGDCTHMDVDEEPVKEWDHD